MFFIGLWKPFKESIFLYGISLIREIQISHFLQKQNFPSF